MDVSVLALCAPGSKAEMLRRPLVSCRRIWSLIGSLMPYRPLGLPAVLVVRQLRLKRVHLRLRVEEPGFECAEGGEKIHGGVDQHFYPDRGVLTLPQVAQRGHAVPNDLRLACHPVNTTPRALEMAFELVQRVPQRGQQGLDLVLLSHT